MRADTIKIYRSVHTWTGILSGFALFIAFFAGALTMFAEPLALWAGAPAASAMAPLARSPELIAATLAARPDARKELTLHLDGDAGAPARLSWRSGRADHAPWTADLAADGSLRLERKHPTGLARFIDQLHRSAGLPGDPEVSEKLVGAISMLYAVALVSGLIVALPALLKDLFALRLGRNLKRMWLDAHNAIGIASLPFHLLIAVTAAVFCWHDLIYPAQDALIYGGKQGAAMKASSPYRALKPDPAPAPMLAPAALLARVRALAPQFEPVTLQYRAPGTAGAQLRVSGHDPRYMIRSEGFLIMSPVTGAILNTDYLPGSQGAWNAPVSALFSLHFGSFGGEPVRWAYFTLGLAGAFLFYSGNLLWIESRRKPARGGPAVLQTRPARLLAAATAGVCLGSVAAVGLTIAAAKGLHGRVADLNGWYEGIYYLVFLACVAWAFWRGAARAGVELLWFGAAAYAAIPLATLAQRLAQPAWSQQWGVDLAAVLAALALAALARAAARRARGAVTDSVWALPPALTPAAPR